MVYLLKLCKIYHAILNLMNENTSSQEGNTIRTIQLGIMVINRHFIINIETKNKNKKGKE